MTVVLVLCKYQKRDFTAPAVKCLLGTSRAAMFRLRNVAQPKTLRNLNIAALLAFLKIAILTAGWRIRRR